MPDSAPTATGTTITASPNRGGNDASQVTPLSESPLQESGLIAETSTEGITPTSNRRGALRSSWPDAFREATAIDINIAGFRIYFRVGLLLIVLLGLSFLYLILQTKQPTSVDPKPPAFFPELDPKEGPGNAFHNATMAFTEEILEKVNAASAHHTKIVFVRRTLFYVAWATTTTSTILDLLPIAILVVGFCDLVTQTCKRLLRRRTRQAGTEWNDDPDDVLPDTSTRRTSHLFRTWHSPSLLLTRLVVDITSVYYLCTEATIPGCILIIVGNTFTLASLRIPNIKKTYRLIDATLAQAVEWIAERFPERQAQGSNQRVEQNVERGISEISTSECVSVQVREIPTSEYVPVEMLPSGYREVPSPSTPQLRANPD